MQHSSSNSTSTHGARQQETTLPSSLPPEILYEIFITACRNSPYSRLSLSQVCQSWRYAALACSELWTHVHANLQMPEAVFKEYLDTCVPRAKSRPLTLICKEDGNQSDTVRVLLNSTSASLWKEIDWSVIDDWGVFDERLKLLVQNSSDTLESLTLKISQDPLQYVYGEVIRKTLNLKCSTRLSKLSLTLRPAVYLYCLDAHWEQLKELYIKTPVSDDYTALGIFRQCPNLESCTLLIGQIILCNLYNSATVPGACAKITSNRLRKLHVQSDRNAIVELLALNLITPVLHDLVVDAERSKPEWPFNLYLSSCSSTLRRLWLRNVTFDPVSCFMRPEIDLLEELVIVDKGSLDPFIVSFFNASWQYNLRRLKILKIICKVDQFLQNSFVELVKSRWWPDSEDSDTRCTHAVRLQCATLQHVVPGEEVIESSEVKELREAGMDIKVLMHSEDMFTPKFSSEDDT